MATDDTSDTKFKADYAEFSRKYVHLGAEPARKELFDLMMEKLQTAIDKLPQQMAMLHTESVDDDKDDEDVKEYAASIVKEVDETLKKFNAAEFINDLLDCYDDEELIYLAQEQKNPIRQRITDKTNKVACTVLKSLVKQVLVVFEGQIDVFKKEEIKRHMEVFEKVMMS